MSNNTDVKKLNYEKHLISLNAVVQQKQIVFIDSLIEDYQVLAAGVLPEIEVIKIDSNRDGVQQITEVLSQKPYSQVHIVSHGAPGCLHLGNTNQPSQGGVRSRQRFSIKSSYSQ